METLGLITLYSTLMLAGLTVVAAVFTLLGIWLSNQTTEEYATH